MSMSGNFISKLQSFLKVTKSELIISFIVVGGLLIGAAGKMYLGSNTIENTKDLAFILDSLAEAERKTYTGTDYDNNPIPELSETDTTLEKDTFFPSKKKKEVKPEPDKPLLININTASRVELDKLPGIGPKTADKIIKYRENNQFDSKEEIMKVKGIGEGKFAKMKEFITF